MSLPWNGIKEVALCKRKGELMKFGFYALREWGWLWIALGILLLVGGCMIDGAWPQPELVLWSLVIISFGAIGAPAIRGLIEDGLK